MFVVLVTNTKTYTHDVYGPFLTDAVAINWIIRKQLPPEYSWSIKRMQSTEIKET